MVTQGSSESNIHIFVGVPFVRTSICGLVEGNLGRRFNEGIGSYFLRSRSYKSFGLQEDRDACTPNRQLFLRFLCFLEQGDIALTHGESRHASFLDDYRVVFLRGTVPFNGSKGCVFMRLYTR